MATGYFKINYSGKNKKLSSSNYRYNLRLDEDRGDLVSYGFYNIPKIYNIEQLDKRLTLLEYYYDLEKYSRKNAVLSINFIAMIPREFSTKYKDQSLYNLYTDIGHTLIKRLSDSLSDEIKHIGVFAVHNIISSTDGEVQPHLHIQVSARGYNEDDLNSGELDSYKFINEGIYNKNLQHVSTYYSTRKIFVDTMNEYLVKEGFNARFEEKSLTSKLMDLDINSDVSEIIQVLKEDVLHSEGISFIDINEAIAQYNVDLEKYQVYKNLQDVIDQNKESMDGVSKVKDTSAVGDDYVLKLMDKRNRLFNKILNFDEELYQINGDARYKSYILAREKSEGLYVDDYLDVDKIIMSEDKNQNLKEYYKIGHIGNLITKLNKSLKERGLEDYGFRYLGIDDLNTNSIISTISNMVTLSKNMTALDKKEEVDYILGDKDNLHNLNISKDIKKIGNKYVNMLVNMIEYDALIQIGLSERKEDNLLRQVYDGKNISNLTIEDTKTLAEHIDENILIFDEFTYSDALNVLKELEKQIKANRDKEDEESKQQVQRDYEYFMRLKDTLTSNDMKTKISKLKKEYSDYMAKLNEYKQDDLMRTRIQSIVDVYKLNYIKSQDSESKVSKLVNKYHENEKIKKLNNKVNLEEFI